jgi:hypothetical protein
MDMFDVANSTWYGPWELTATTLAWPNCVGGGTGAVDAGCGSGNEPFCADNDPRAHIAVDWKSTAGAFYEVHTVNPLGHGTRVRMDFGTISCVDGNPQPSTSVNIDPPPCDINPLNGQCTWNNGVAFDGGSRVQDEWGQTVSFNYNGATPRVVETWFTTRDDPNDVNVDLYMQYSENNGATWSAVHAVSLAGAGQTVPWDYHLSDWSDYQSLAPDTVHGGFLGAWGGDCRSGSGNCSVYSEVMQ